MEYGTIEREIHIDARPEVVFDVISRPEHIRDWWMAETDVMPVAGADSQLTWVDAETGRTQAHRITVVDADPPRRFVFRWKHPAGGTDEARRGLLVTFELTAAGSGTTLHLTETGFREMGWEAAVLEEQYNDHVTGWAFFLPRLQAVAEVTER